jgi:hypothetical protein
MKNVSLHVFVISSTPQGRQKDEGKERRKIEKH